MSHQTATIGDTVYFYFAANDTSGSGADGATPVFDVREAGALASAIPLLSGAATLLTHANYPAGLHEIAVVATVGNGFAADDMFAVFATVLVDAQNPSGFVGTCKLTPLATAAALTTVDTVVNGIQIDLSNTTDGLGAIKADTASTLTDTAEIGVAGAGLTAIDLPNQTMDITGNLSGSVGSVVGHTPQAADHTAGISNIQSRIPASLLNGRMQSNVDAISDDSIAADNLELQYDGTGISGDTFPSTQNQLGSIANVGSATHKPSSSYVLTTGTQTANLFSDAEALDAVRHTHADVAGVLDFLYQFQIGSGSPSSVQVTGFLNSNNDDVDILGFDWVSSTWKQIGNIQGSNGSTNNVYSLDMFVDMVGSDANKGIVRVRFFKASGLTGSSLAIDQIFVAFTIGLDGYEGGAIWYDDAAANTGVEVGIDGTSRNPVSTPAAVESLLISTGLHRVHVAPGSTYLMATDHSNREIFGQEWFLGLGGQTVNGSHFSGCEVTGTGVGTIRCSFHQGSIGIASLPICDIFDCFHSGKLTLTGAGTYNLYHSAHAMNSGAFQLEYGATLGNTSVHNHGYEGAITVANMGTLGTDALHLSGNGKVIFEASCVTGGTANVFGFEIIDSSGVGFVINSSGNINTQIAAIPTTPMRGTNSVPLNPALATDYTVARAVKLDNLDALISSRNAIAPNTVIPIAAASAATLAKQNTAQADLDLLTGVDGATLATLQANYAPAKSGDAMALTGAADMSIADAIWGKVLETHGAYTAQQILRVGLAVLAGVTATGGSILKTPDGVATKVTATVNASNERTAMTLTPDA